MTKNKNTPGYQGFALPGELVAQRVAFAGSGASGMHMDQHSRIYRTGQRNRIGSRSARTRAAIRNDGW